VNVSARTALAALADELVPAGDGMPSASEAGVAHGGVDRVLAVCPELAEPLGHILGRARDCTATEVLAELAGDEEAFRLLAFVVVGAYLTEPVVMGRLGYRGRQAAPVRDDIDDEVVELLERVLERGPVYREPPS
jgi:hypothetical protein